MVPNNSQKYLNSDVLMDSFFESSTNSAIPAFFDITYRTYIPYQSVKNPNPISKANYLKGDNRTSHQPYSDKYRTEARVYAQFDYPPAITLWPDVNPTYSCKTSSCSNPKNEGTASTSGLKFTRTQNKKTILNGE